MLEIQHPMGDLQHLGVGCGSRRLRLPATEEDASSRGQGLMELSRRAAVWFTGGCACGREERTSGQSRGDLRRFGHV